MFWNYLKITFRTLFKQRVHAGINLMGLALGLACTTLIALWIRHELSMNQFHEHKAELFRVLEHQTYDDAIFTFAATPGPLMEKLKTTFPEITYASRASWGERSLLSYGNESFYQQGRSVEPDFLKMFTFPLVLGDPETALSGPNNILITRELAEKYFGADNPMGKVVRLNEEADYIVAGVLADIPENSTLKFDYLIPLDNYLKQNDFLSTWTNNSIQTYFRARPELSAAAITGKIKNIVAENGQENVELLAQPLADWHLRSDFQNGKLQGGRIDSVRMFGIIAGLILLIACINFMNLSTAKSVNRAMEVGVRKVSGATRGALASQFLTESLLMAVLAGLLGLILVAIALPYFNRLFSLELSMQSPGATFWLGMGAVVLMTGLLSGSYPAFFLSGFQPMKVLKGLAKTSSSAVGLRKVLVTGQFAISILLIVGTMVIYQQIQFIKNKNLGYDKGNLMYVPVNGALWEKYEALKTELQQIPGIISVSSTTGQIHQWGNNTSDVGWEGKDPEKAILFQTIPVGYDFVQTIGASLKDGRDFSPEFPADSTNFLINETAARLMGMEHPVGQTMSLWGESGRILGCLKDFHLGSFHQAQDPAILILRPWKNFIYLRIRPGDGLNELLDALEKMFHKFNPAYPFEYYFTDKEYEDLHRNEQRTGELAKVFAFLAVFVSCLGLFGLASFMAEQRTKEIGIRKVLGASVGGITRLLTMEFLKLVFIAIFLASPLAYYFMNLWLQDFAYRIDIPWWVFMLAGLSAVAVAFLTVSFQSVKAALANPVQALRSE